MDARITKTIIEIYYQGERLCSHTRVYGRTNQYSTNINHMPLKHQEALEWNGDRLRSWAQKIGPNTYDVINRLLKSYKAEQQGYTGCRSLLKLSDKYSNKELDNACEIVLKHTSIPRYKNIKLILEAGQRNLTERVEETNENDGAILRGATYYGGKTNE